MINFKKKKRWHCLAGQQPTEMDLKIMEWERKGKLVPTRELVKTPEQIEGIRVAGKINSGCLDAVAEMIRPGISTKDIDNVCVEYCKAHNAISATLGYEGFPGSLCTSINEVVAHGIPKEQDVLEPGDIVNVDITLGYNGYYGDASRMFIIGGETTPEKEQLVRVTKECLEIGAAAAKPYGFAGDIGHAIQKACREAWLWRSARPLRPWCRTEDARGARDTPLRPSWHRHALGTRNGIYHRADDQYGNMEGLHRRRRPLWMGGYHGRRKAIGTMGAHLPHDREWRGDSLRIMWKDSLRITWKEFL